MTFPKLTVQGRADRLRNAMRERELDGFVVVDLPSVRWLTGFAGSNGLAVISAKDVVLATDGRYATQAPAQLEAAGSDATVVIASDLVASGADVLRGAARVALEGDVISWDQQRQWAAALADSELVAVSGLLRELRSVKDPAELARIEAAAALAGGLAMPGAVEQPGGGAVGGASLSARSSLGDFRSSLQVVPPRRRFWRLLARVVLVCFGVVPSLPCWAISRAFFFEHMYLR